MGHMAALLSSMKSYGRSHFQQKMQQLRIRMDKLQLPTGLQNRVQQYYEHLWKEYDTTDSDIMGFTRELTHPLALEVGLCRYMALVTRVFIWSDCSPDFLSALVVRLNVRVYLAEDYIIRKGEIGYELFVVHRGVCEIASSRKDAYRRTNGGVFGELSLIMDYMRSSAVRALTNLELCVLDRRSFQDLVSHHHDERHRVVARMLRRSLEMNESPLLWQEVLLQTARMPAKRTPHETPSQSSAEQITETDPRDVITVLEAAEILAEKMNMDVARGEPMLVNIGHGLHGTIERREYTRQRRQLYRALSNSSASSAADRALQQPLLSLQTQSFCSPVQMTPPSVPPPAQAPPAQAVTMTAAEPSASNTSQLQCHNCASNNAAATSAEALQTTSSLVEEVADTQSQLLRLVRTLTESIERMETQLIRVEDKVFALEDAQIRLSPHASRTSNSLVSISIPSTSKEDDQDGGDGYADEASLPYPMLDRWQRNPRACLRQTSRSTREQHATQALRRWTKVN
ncbi:TPA: hypothetical protein N0F65_009817 [Lagenidium giganteum]|uniref:Cyclic nucleotide-binding domain-containing protein n=1 Tax=Lagenidium giganteum TaxID=4803 RepID=A0AAV2YV82_9STRA|nr:TPA: hypothetical protein N0F65_009817 [Lagenidium giganteum]